MLVRNVGHHMSTDMVRFVPAADFAGTATITYRAWDRTVGTAGSLATIGATGSTSAYSTGENTAAIVVGAAFLNGLQVVGKDIKDVKLVTSLFFDIGVFLVVLGLVLDVVRSLGAEIDRHSDADAREEAAR